MAIVEKEKALDVVRQMVADGQVSQEVAEKYFPELKESEGLRIIKAIKYGLDHVFTNNTTVFEVTKEQCLSWLEAQGEHANFRNKIQIGDKVTRNEDGVLVNLSQLNRVAKKQGEQKPYGQRQECVGCQFNYAGECKGSCAMKRGEQKPAWSEEDELIVAKILCICNDFERSFESSPSSMKVIKEDVDKIDNWLKFLKNKYIWKPSDEHMDALRYVTNFDYGGYKATLVSLYEQLKKLRGE